MRRLFDRAFWRFLLGFLVILAVSFSILFVTGAYRDAKEKIAALRVRFSLGASAPAVSERE